MSTTKPVFMRQSHDEQRIIHREKIAKLVTPGTGAFTVLAAIALNPGIVASFPWLSNEAAGWESYRFNRVRTVWVPTSGTQVAGDIIMAPDYDAADPAPTGETAMSSYSDAEEANVWARFACDMETQFLNGESRRKYVRTGALAPNLDIKTYDSGNLFVASTDDAAANTGKLWIEYDVTLFNPHVPPGGFQAAGQLIGAGGTFAAATPFGAAPVSNGPLPVTNPLGNANITISNVQVGQEIQVSALLLGTVITALTGAAGIGCVLKTAGSATTMVNGAATAAATWQTYTVTAQNPTIQYTIAATTVTASAVSVTVIAPTTALI
jgi:phage baseplate assembly protein gpV